MRCQCCGAWFIIPVGLASPNRFSFAVVNWPCGQLAEWFHVAHAPTVNGGSKAIAKVQEDLGSILANSTLLGDASRGWAQSGAPARRVLYDDVIRLVALSRSCIT